jgi:hypothetical protein
MGGLAQLARRFFAITIIPNGRHKTVPSKTLVDLFKRS